jgi:hypothetical protein
MAERGTSSDPQQVQVAVRVDLLDVDRDRLLDEHLSGVVLDLGVAHPEVLPSLLVDPGDRPMVRPVTFGLPAKRNVTLPVAEAALRSGGAEEQALAGAKPLNDRRVDLAGQRNSV